MKNWNNEIEALAIRWRKDRGYPESVPVELTAHADGGLTFIVNQGVLAAHREAEKKAQEQRRAEALAARVAMLTALDARVERIEYQGGERSRGRALYGQSSAPLSNEISVECADGFAVIKLTHWRTALTVDALGEVVRKAMSALW